MTGSKLDFSSFQCLQCKSCCRQEGYVRLEENEPDRIAEFLNMGVLEFIDQYTVLTRDRHGLSLVEKQDFTCVFLTETGCRINAVKPSQCRDFPYKWRFKDWEKTCEWAISHKQRKSP